jgi:hypothetical protein
MTPELDLMITMNKEHASGYLRNGRKDPKAIS